MTDPPKLRHPERYELRLSDDVRLPIDRWRVEQKPPLSRAAAIRALVDRGLAADAEIARLRALLAADGRNEVPPEGADPDKHEGGTK